MARSITGITNTASQSIDTLVALANTMASMISQEVVTANNSADGAATTGNTQLSGILGATVGAFGAIRGGSVNSTAALPISSNLTFTNTSSQVSFGNSTVNSSMNSSSMAVPAAAIASANVLYFNQASIPFGNTVITDVVATINGSPSQLVDSFPIGTLRSAEYLLSTTDNAANNYSTTKVLVVHDGGTAYMTAYGTLNTNSDVIAFQVSANSTAVRLLGSTVSSANVTVRGIRMALKP